MPRRNPLKVNSELVQRFVGRWKIETAIYQDCEGEDVGVVATADDDVAMSTVKELNSVEFTLDDQYDVTWHVPAGTEDNPLFQTTSFEVDENGVTLEGCSDGRSYFFEVKELIRDQFQLANSIFCMIITKMVVPDLSDIGPYSLLDALNESYFSDLTIRSSQGQKFAVHRSVLNVACPGVKYRDWEMLLSGLSSETLSAALHYVYSSKLPADFGVGVAKELAEVAGRNQKLSQLRELCLSCVESHTLSKRLQELVDSLVHSLDVARQIIMSAKMDDPAKLVYAAKQLAREAAIAGSRFVLLCQLYTQNKKEMTKSEKKEILEYVQGRIVVFVSEGKELLQLLIAKWQSLSDEQRREIALYIIPDVERIWGRVNEHTVRLHAAMEEQDILEHHQQRPTSWKLALALQFVSKKKERSRVKKLKKEFKKFVSIGESKRLQFMSLPDDEKIDKIERVVQEMIQDGEDAIRRLDELKKKILLANVLDWGSYRLGVSFTCSYISWGLNKVLSLKDPVKLLAQRLSHLIGHEEFNSTLVQLGVVDPGDLFDEGQLPAIPPLPQLSYNKCSMSFRNLLAEGSQRLLETGEQSDMELVVLDTTTPSENSTHNPLGITQDEDDAQKGVVIPAHRVILAARSEWFRRALQSGMIEDRCRRVVIQDVELSLFRTFLEYLYGKDLGIVSKDEIIELLAVADRYETSSLHKLCQCQLIAQINNENVFSLLTISNQLSARQLKAHTLQYILDNPDLVMSQVESYSDLPSDIKQEVRLLLSGTQDLSQYRTRHVSRPILSSLDIDEGEFPVTLSDNSPYTIGDDMQTCLTELRAIVGDDPSEDMLKDILMAADMDINRAVNFFFGTQ